MRKFLVLTLVLAFCANAHAALGGIPAKLDSTDNPVRARALKQASAGYSVIETTLTSTTVVREYVLPNGTVFAVSWEGPFKPDLEALLGEHLRTAQEEVAKNPRNARTRLSVNRAGVIIHATGRMRSHRGRAWLPAMLPSGFSTDNIR